MKKVNSPNKDKTRLLKRLSFVFLVIFCLTVVTGLLISGSSVALFTGFSDTITYSFSAEEPYSPTLQDNLDHLIQEIKNLDILKDSTHLYRPTGGRPANAWSLRIEDHLKEGSPANSNVYGFKNPVSNSEWVVNQATLPSHEDYWNPAVFITTEGEHTNPNNAPDSRLWGSMIIFNTGQGQDDTMINYFVIDENGVTGVLNSFPIKDYD